MTKVKVCGLQTTKDAHMCIAAGVDAVGFIFAPSKRQISAKEAAKIAAILPPFISRVGVFVDMSKEAVDNIAKEVGLTVLQFHGSEDSVYCRSFALPVIKAIRVRSKADLLGIDTHPAAAVLLDSYHPTLNGGTGVAFDWTVIDQRPAKPVILAGGLHEGNIAAAIRTIHPYAVDVSSGVETAGKKDPEKIRAFTETVRRCG